jgi:hypothetical protein
LLTREFTLHCPTMNMIWDIYEDKKDNVPRVFRMKIVLLF